jgi:hypothetical protein
MLSATYPRADQSSDLVALLTQADGVQKADTAAWSRFRFHRRHVKEYLDVEGHTTKMEDLTFDVTPGSKGFDELLVTRDGRAPTANEVVSGRQEAKFSKHYATMLSGDAEDDEEGAYSLGVLFRLASYRLTGRESIDGIDCYRIDFSPDPLKATRGVAGRFAEAMEGSLWVTVDGLHLLRARARTTHEISIALSLGKVYELQVEMDGGMVAGGVCLPRRIAVRTSARILVKRIRQRNVYTYSGFSPVRD